MQERMEKPLVRGDLRLALGKRYFTARRYFSWVFGGLHFARISSAELPFVYASHSTPLFRQLRDVDMVLQHNKVANLRLAVPRVNHVTLHPGETFSYWRLIGKATKRRGYQQGMVLKNGGFTAGYGGGLCQLSNLIYWMTVHTPLTVTERHRHGYDVFPDANRTQPFGSGATCFYNYGDLMIRNDTNQTFQLSLRITETDLIGEWRCELAPDCRYEVYEKEHLMKLEPWGGYSRHNLLFRRKYAMDGELLDDEYVVENHAMMMYAPLLPENRDEGDAR